jgi:hypothetical protein
MNALQVAKMVAAHPVIIKLRNRQMAMYRQMVRDYGYNFASDAPKMRINGKPVDRFAGVHYWTKAQRDEWMQLETRLSNARKALRSAYAAV